MEIYEEFDVQITTFKSIMENLDVITSSKPDDEHDNSYTDISELE
jgi:hypothetical protein